MKKLIAFLVAIVAAVGLSVGAAAPAQAYPTTEFTVDDTGITLLNGNTWNDTSNLKIHFWDGIFVLVDEPFDDPNFTTTSDTFMAWADLPRHPYNPVMDVYITIDGVVEHYMGDASFLPRDENGVPYASSWGELKFEAEARCLNGKVYTYIKVTNTKIDLTYTVTPLSSVSPVTAAGPAKVIAPGETGVWIINQRTSNLQDPVAYFDLTLEYNGQILPNGYGIGYAGITC